MKRVPLSGSEKKIQDIWDWYECQSRLSLRKKSQLLQEVHNNGPMSDPRFYGMSIQDINEFFRELDYLTMLDLIASTEATIRLDYLNRVYCRKKDSVSRRFRDMYKERGNEVGLERDILETWKELVPATRKAVGDFNGALNLRNWLAHGRYLKPRLGREYFPGDVYDISFNLISAITV